MRPIRSRLTKNVCWLFRGLTLHSGQVLISPLIKPGMPIILKHRSTLSTIFRNGTRWIKRGISGPLTRLAARLLNYGNGQALIIKQQRSWAVPQDLSTRELSNSRMRILQNGDVAGQMLAQTLLVQAYLFCRKQAGRNNVFK